MMRAVRHPHNPATKPQLPRAATVALVALAAVFFVARNLPAFSWLGSTA
jgi:hypothetical protein